MVEKLDDLLAIAEQFGWRYTNSVSGYQHTYCFYKQGRKLCLVLSRVDKMDKVDYAGHGLNAINAWIENGNITAFINNAHINYIARFMRRGDWTITL